MRHLANICYKYILASYLHGKMFGLLWHFMNCVWGYNVHFCSVPIRAEGWELSNIMLFDINRESQDRLMGYINFVSLNWTVKNYLICWKKVCLVKWVQERDTWCPLARCGFSGTIRYYMDFALQRWGIKDCKEWDMTVPCTCQTFFSLIDSHSLVLRLRDFPSNSRLLCICSVFRKFFSTIIF